MTAEHAPGLKPLRRKAYGSIGHLPGSRTGPGDHTITGGQARICTEKVRDRHDLVVVQEKLDGSCVAVARLGDGLHALGRAGWPAQSSRWAQHQHFAAWVREHAERFLTVLHPGERLVGEWLAQAHGTRYALEDREPFAAFDLMCEDTRAPFDEFQHRVGGVFEQPTLLHRGRPLAVEDALRLHARPEGHWPSDGIEGVVYRVERRGTVDFLAKYVLPDKIDGRYLPEMSGKPPVWNWIRKNQAARDHAACAG